MKTILASILVLFTLVACARDDMSMISESKQGVVAIVSTVEATDNEKGGNGLGTGSIIDENMILTNFHVAGTAKELDVLFNENDTPYEAELVYGDKESDIAIIKLKDWEKFTKENPGYQILHYALGPTKEGAIVYSIGHPWGLFYSVSRGIVSTSKRKSPSEIPMWWIQTDAKVYNGNSGGPLLNEDGEIVGMNSVMLANDGGSYGFAIPVQVITKVVNDLEKYKETRWASIGISMKGPGVIVAEIMPNGAAAKSELKVNDKIIGMIVDHKKTDIDDTLDLISAMSVIDYDTNVILVVDRDGDIFNIAVKPAYKTTADYKK